MTAYPSCRTTRLRHYDYSQSGAYFVTLCIEQRLPLLGQITEGRAELSPADVTVVAVWGSLAQFHPIRPDAFTVNPNHLHGILVLGGSSAGGWRRVAAPAGARGGMSLSAVMPHFQTLAKHKSGTRAAAQG